MVRRKDRYGHPIRWKGYEGEESQFGWFIEAIDPEEHEFPPSLRPVAVEKGDERRVAGVDYRANEVLLDDRNGGTVAWKPDEIGGRQGGSKVHKVEGIELRAGDRIRWTRNDTGLRLVNGRTAEVIAVKNGRVTFRLEDGKAREAPVSERSMGRDTGLEL